MILFTPHALCCTVTLLSKNIIAVGSVFDLMEDDIHIQGRTQVRGGLLGCNPSQNPQTRNLKNTYLVDITISKAYVISPSAGISH
jgi:hypothetical protein